MCDDCRDEQFAYIPTQQEIQQLTAIFKEQQLESFRLNGAGGRPRGKNIRRGAKREYIEPQKFQPKIYHVNFNSRGAKDE